MVSVTCCCDNSHCKDNHHLHVHWSHHVITTRYFIRGDNTSLGLFCSTETKMIKTGSIFKIVIPCKSNVELPLNYHLIYLVCGTHIYTRKLKHFYEHFLKNSHDFPVNNSLIVPSLWKRKNFRLWVETWLKLVDDSEVSDVHFDYDILIKYN